MVSKETLMKRMEKELAEAKVRVNDREAFLRSIEKVKLLCELLLDESDTNQSTEPIQITKPVQVTEPVVKKKIYEDEDINHQPESIFDF